MQSIEKSAFLKETIGCIQIQKEKLCIFLHTTQKQFYSFQVSFLMKVIRSVNFLKILIELPVETIVEIERCLIHHLQ